MSCPLCGGTLELSPSQARRCAACDSLFTAEGGRVPLPVGTDPLVFSQTLGFPGPPVRRVPPAAPTFAPVALPRGATLAARALSAGIGCAVTLAVGGGVLVSVLGLLVYLYLELSGNGGGGGGRHRRH